MEVTSIGTHYFEIDTSSQQGFEEGVSFGRENINPVISGFLSNPHLKIAMVIPQETAFYGQFPEQKGSTITASFFVGALEELFRAVRDQYYPELEVQTNRDRIKPVAGRDHEVPDDGELISGIFKTAWETCDPLEQFLKERVFVGIKAEDGFITLAKWDNERMLISEPADEDAALKLSGWGNKFFKAMDSMFLNNLTLCAKLQEDMPDGAEFVQ